MSPPVDEPAVALSEPASVLASIATEALRIEARAPLEPPRPDFGALFEEIARSEKPLAALSPLGPGVAVLTPISPDAGIAATVGALKRLVKRSIVAATGFYPARIVAQVNRLVAELNEAAVVTAEALRELSERVDALESLPGAVGYARPPAAGAVGDAGPPAAGAVGDAGPPAAGADDLGDLRPPRRPVRIDQIIPSIVARDAVSRHTFEVQAILTGLGYESGIYALSIGADVASRVSPLASLPRIADGSQWVIYQASIGSPAAGAFRSHPGWKLLNYHNITPAALLEEWEPLVAAEVRLGRSQLRSLAPEVGLAIAVSRYNESELAGAGYRRTAVAPLIVDPGRDLGAPDPRTLRRLEDSKRATALAARTGSRSSPSSRSDGAGSSAGAVCVDWLVVGQVSPHKAQHDVVSAFAAYRQAYGGASRLFVVGRNLSDRYARALRGYIEALGLEKSVELVGSASPEVLAAYFRAADVLVMCSDHEGYGAPLLEAMSAGVPVVAYGAGAVPETVGDAGLVLASKSPYLVAAAVRRVATDPALAAALRDAGRSRASTRGREPAAAAFRAVIGSEIDRALP